MNAKTLTASAATKANKNKVSHRLLPTAYAAQAIGVHKGATNKNDTAKVVSTFGVSLVAHQITKAIISVAATVAAIIGHSLRRLCSMPLIVAGGEELG